MQHMSICFHHWRSVRHRQLPQLFKHHLRSDQVHSMLQFTSQWQLLLYHFRSKLLLYRRHYHSGEPYHLNLKQTKTKLWLSYG